MPLVSVGSSGMESRNDTRAAIGRTATSALRRFFGRLSGKPLLATVELRIDTKIEAQGRAKNSL
jgi:hypothetical protein